MAHKGSALAALVVVALIAGCSSPEARRARQGGPGADVGNRDGVVTLHEGSQPYFKTPTPVQDLERRAAETASASRR